MVLIEWKDEYSVGIEKIDDQHKTLIEMINDLNEAMLNRIGQETAGEIIESLIYYTDSHFRTEEELFDNFSYPDSASHKKEHSDFVKKVSDFRKDHESGKIGLSVYIIEFLSTWLKNHITGTDMKYASFFEGKNI